MATKHVYSATFSSGPAIGAVSENTYTHAWQVRFMSAFGQAAIASGFSESREQALYSAGAALRRNATRYAGPNVAEIAPAVVTP